MKSLANSPCAKQELRPVLAIVSIVKSVWPWAGLALCLGVWFSTRDGRSDQRAGAFPPAISSSGLRMKPIEDLRVGDRVLSDNPDVDSPPETRVNPKIWRLLKLRAETLWADGTIDDINVETLQPPEWVEEHKAKVGQIVPLPLDLIEMGLPGELRAVVLANQPCPAIKPRPGRVVLTTVNHLNADVRELTLINNKGNETTIRPTGLHKFSRIHDGAWVSAQELQPGSIIRAGCGRITVLANSPVPGVHRVYNLTVEGEHVYEVSALAIVAHNIECGPYRNVGCHHIHQKAAFLRNTSYNPRSGFSISQGYMNSRGWNHGAMTTKQRELFDELARSGRPNTLAEHSRIAEEALIAGGATREEARQLVQASVENLQAQGVAGPSGIPWNQ